MGLRWFLFTMIVRIGPDAVVYERKFQGLCRKPYHAHPEGCPNFGKKKGCPPRQPLIDEVFDLGRELYVIYTIFPVGKFAERMRLAHPRWAEQPRQLYNPLRWQKRARNEHSREVERFLAEHNGMKVDRCPEARGVNITHLMRSVGVELDWRWPPKHSVKNVKHVVSLAGWPVRE